MNDAELTQSIDGVSFQLKTLLEKSRRTQVIIDKLFSVEADNLTIIKSWEVDKYKVIYVTFEFEKPLTDEQVKLLGNFFRFTMDGNNQIEISLGSMI